MLRNLLQNIDYENRTEIYTLAIKTLNEALSIKLLNAIYEEITSFYIKKRVEKTKFVYDVLVKRIDSVLQYEKLIPLQNK